MTTWKELKDNPRLFGLFQTRAQIIRLTREFFWSNGFTEADVPVAIRCPGQEPYLHPVPVLFHHPNGHGEQFYLHTSPEFALKKLLAAGMGQVFSITKCFRDYEAFGDGTHNTEFTMIEWYRAPGGFQDFMADTERLFNHVAEQLQTPHVSYRGRTIDITAPWQRRTMKEVWQEHAGIHLDSFLEIEPLQALAEKKGYAIGKEDTYEDIFFKIFLNEIEPKLGQEVPLFVYDYPARMCSLSRLSERDPRYAERAELYIAGLEIANGFGELVDVDEQLRRLESDRRLREHLDKPTWAVDPDFIAALRAGIPPAGGIALGIDRMVLLFTGADTINEIIFQTVSDQLAINL